jgi:trimeric autotransporter adhesin
MASTYSQYKIELVGTGEQAGTWGTTTNNNFGSATPGTYQGFEQAIGGRADVTMSGTTTLSLTNSNAAQDARALYLNLSGTLSGAADLVVPVLQKSYLVKNGTTGGFAVTIKVTGQTGVSIPNGKTVWVYNNGTDVVTAVDFIPEIATTTVDTTNIEVTNIKAKDGTAAGSIADSTGVVTLASSVLTTTDINGGTIDGAVIGGASAAAGSFTTLAASSTLTVTGAGSIQGLTVGQGAGSVSTNTAVGASALAANTTGANNTAVGYQALDANTTGATNTAVGSGALGVNTTGGNNVAVGYNALDANTTGNSNVAVGREALTTHDTAAGSCVAVGYRALYLNATGISNTAIGTVCLYNNTANNNTAVGDSAMFANTTGGNNTAMGAGALDTNTTGANNTALGYLALTANTTGAANTAVGYQALDACTTGVQNTAVGRDSLGELTTGTNNTALGFLAGTSTTATTTGESNLFLGAYTRASSATTSGEIVIGFNFAGQAADNVTIGNSGGKIYNAFTVNATWTQTSDERLKKNIQDDTLGLSFVNRLRPVKYQWKPSNEIDPSLPYYNEENNRNTETVMHGLVAQEVKAALDAEGVSTFAGWDVGSDTIQAISREMFVTPLINAIKELSAKCDSLQAEINTLKGQ